MDKNLKGILQQLEAEKSVNRETLVEAIRSAIESAARKGMTHASDVVVEVDQRDIEFKVFEIRKVVESIEDETSEILLEKAQELNPNVQVGNRIKIETQPKDFGRIAAQTAKQVIIQKIKDAERDNIYDEFKSREGELVSGVVKRYAQGNVVVTIDKAEAVIPPKEQAQRENLRPGDRVRAVLTSVEKTPRGAQIILSRATPELVKSLFEMEVPEIFDGTIEIKMVAREAGSRTKVAVNSIDPNVDPVGACVGMKGSRVRSVVEELSGEKIDIIRWSENPVELCANSLNPADILEIELDEESKTVTVTVPHDQLSLAIGKKGQNARLASRLMGWNIDIKSNDGTEQASAVVESEDVVESEGSADVEEVVESSDSAESADSEESSEAAESSESVEELVEE